jgi:hypothetical protein
VAVTLAYGHAVHLERENARLLAENSIQREKADEWKEKYQEEKNNAAIIAASLKHLRRSHKVQKILIAVGVAILGISGRACLDAETFAWACGFGLVGIVIAALGFFYPFEDVGD